MSEFKIFWKLVFIPLDIFLVKSALSYQDGKIRQNGCQIRVSHPRKPPETNFKKIQKISKKKFFGTAIPKDYRELKCIFINIFQLLKIFSALLFQMAFLLNKGWIKKECGQNLSTKIPYLFNNFQKCHPKCKISIKLALKTKRGSRL